MPLGSCHRAPTRPAGLLACPGTLLDTDRRRIDRWRNAPGRRGSLMGDASVRRPVDIGPRRREGRFGPQGERNAQRSARAQPPPPGRSSHARHMPPPSAARRSRAALGPRARRSGARGHRHRLGPDRLRCPPGTGNGNATRRRPGRALDRAPGDGPRRRLRRGERDRRRPRAVRLRARGGRWYSQDAAVATAAHRAGRRRPRHPRRAPDRHRHRVPDRARRDRRAGAAKAGGIATGEAAAAALLAARAGDGRFGPFRFTVGTLPGQWRPTSGVNDPLPG